MSKRRRKQGNKTQNVVKSTNIQTSSNLNPNVNRMPLGSLSLPSLSSLQGRIYEEARSELRFPQSITLYKQMLLDPNIASAIGLLEMMIGKVEWKVELPDQETASEEEKKHCKQLMDNLKLLDRPWEEYIVELLSYISFGFNVSEKVYQKIESPEGSYIGLKNLVTVSQDTVDKWIFDNKTGELKGVRQDLNKIVSDSKRELTQGTWVDLPRKKFLLFRHAPQRDNPEGRSPLKSCYLPWKHRNIIEEYETIGVTKDLGGTPVIGIDVAYLAKATADPTSPEATVVNELKRQAASLHAGDQTFVITPLAYDNAGKELFKFELKGVDGGGKQYNTDEIVKRHDSKILMAFFADVLKLGSDQHGSFALADSKTSILAMGVEAHLRNIANTFNHDLIPQLYQLNRWKYDPQTSCKFTFGDIEKQDLDKLGSFLQRVTATGLIRPSEKLEEKVRGMAFPDLGSFIGDEDIEIETIATSKSGVGMEESLGNGQGSTTAKGGDRSKSNATNK